MTIHQLEEWFPCESPYIIRNAKNGPNFFFVRVEEAKHIEVNVTWTVDLVQPNMTLVMTPDPIISQTSAAFKVNATEPVCEL